MSELSEKDISNMGSNVGSILQQAAVHWGFYVWVRIRRLGMSHHNDNFKPALVMSWSPGLPFKLGDPGSIFGRTRTSTEGLKIIEEKLH